MHELKSKDVLFLEYNWHYVTMVQVNKLGINE